MTRKKTCFAVWFVSSAVATLAAEQGLPQGAALRSGRDSQYYPTTATHSRVLSTPSSLVKTRPEMAPVREKEPSEDTRPISATNVDILLPPGFQDIPCYEIYNWNQYNCYAYGFPVDGFVTVFFNCFQTIKCDAVGVYQVGEPPMDWNAPQCESSWFCGDTPEYDFEADCSNLSDDPCAAFACGGYTKCMPGGDTPWTSDGNMRCRNNFDGTYECHENDMPRGGFVTVYYDCSDDGPKVADCSSCEVFEVDHYDFIDGNTRLCNSCTICGDHSVSDCTNRWPVPCAQMDCDGNCLGTDTECMVDTDCNECFECSGGACQQVANGIPCTDNGLFCDGIETCQSGVCRSAGDPCRNNSKKDICNETKDQCTDPECMIDTDCNECFECSYGVCQQVANGIPCTDNGLFCDGAETCQGGTCKSAGDPCGNTKVCDEMKDQCTDPGCIDDTACNECFECSDGVCQQVANGIHCTNNGLFCDGVETCQNGACNSAGDPCGDNEVCDEMKDQCAPSDMPVDACLAEVNGCSWLFFGGTRMNGSFLGLSCYEICVLDFMVGIMKLFGIACGPCEEV